MLAFLHTAQSHIETFDSLARELDDGIPRRHAMHAELLAGARIAGMPPGVIALRVDRPMAERAVALGSRVAIAAALAGTLAPTRQLLCESAACVGRTVELPDVLCDGAWEHFERGDSGSYLAQVAQALERAAPSDDVVVMAQAAMTRAGELVPNLRVPVLSSPRLGLEAALRCQPILIEREGRSGR